MVAAHAVAVPLVLRYVLETPREQTIVGQFDQFVRREQREDSWRPMGAARAYVEQQPGSDLYEEIFFRRKIKFQYPPTSLLFIDHLSRGALNAVSWIAVWVTVLLSVWLLHAARLDAQQSRLRPASLPDLAISVGSAAGLALTFYPLLKGYTLGQIQVWVDALIAAAIWAWCRRRPVAAGITVGVACLIKPPLAVIAVWALARREWRMLGGLIAACALGLALSIAAYGATSHLTYLRVLAFIAQRGEAYYPNQSFNGLLNRWWSNGDNLEFQDHEFSPPNRWVSAGTTTAGLVLLALAVGLPALRRPVDERIDLAIATITATIVSPIAWEHHYGAALPALAVLAPALLDASRSQAWIAAMLAISFELIGQFFAPAQRLAATSLNPLQSYVLFGALLLLASAYGVVLRPRGAVDRPTSVRTAV